MRLDKDRIAIQAAGVLLIALLLTLLLKSNRKLL
jgi:hypothetical protein